MSNENKVCKHCDEPYDGRPISRKKDYGYCSWDCVEVSKPSCPVCDAPLTRNKNEYASGFLSRTYCSNECRNIGQRKPSQPQKARTCSHCDETYTGRPISREKDYGFCSWDCAIAGRPPCKNCGNIISRHEGESASKYFRRICCCKSCAVKYTYKKEPPKEGPPKTCKHCQETYYGNPISRRRDYGYCSIKCIEVAKPPCPNCEKKFQKREEESTYSYWTRTFCCHECYLTCPPGKYSFMPGKSSGICLYCEESYGGYPLSPREDYGYCSWKCAEADKPFCPECRKTVPHYESDSPSQYFKRTFCSVECGAIHMASRPKTEETRRRMSEVSKKQWADSAYREMMSRAMTIYPDGAGYGPNWVNRAEEVRQRDECCIICGMTIEEHIEWQGKTLIAHHIYNRRLFIPENGDDPNYLWANHPHNLVAVCQSHHGRVEAGNIPLPKEIQERADRHWEKFQERRQQLPLSI